MVRKGQGRRSVSGRRGELWPRCVVFGQRIFGRAILEMASSPAGFPLLGRQLWVQKTDSVVGNPETLPDVIAVVGAFLVDLCLIRR